MRATFHLKTLSVAVAALSVASLASAAGLDRSGQISLHSYKMARMQRLSIPISVLMLVVMIMLT